MQAAGGNKVSRIGLTRKSVELRWNAAEQDFQMAPRATFEPASFAEIMFARVTGKFLQGVVQTGDLAGILY